MIAEAQHTEIEIIPMATNILEPISKVSKNVKQNTEGK